MEKETKQDIIEITRGYVGMILLAILMFTGVVSGTSMYSGESMTFETELTAPVFIVVNNESNLDGLTVKFEDGNITISADPLMASDNFTLVFFDEVTKEVEKIVHTGGGGGGTTYVDKIIIQNETVYIPEYITTTNEVEVEKIVDNTTIIETGYKLWHIIIGMFLGIVFGLYIMINWNKKEKKIKPNDHVS